jgi:methionine sulfoxide reductase heme-binding subunit
MHAQPRMPLLFSGWPLWWMLVVPIAATSLAMLRLSPGYDGIGAALRLTARTSFALFMLAFTAAALARLFPGGFTRWLRANRRILGLAFAASHAIHLCIIVAYWEHGVGAYVRMQPFVGFVANVLGYCVIAAMAITSFSPMNRVIGPRAWSLLHTIGGYYIWLSFAKSYVPRAFNDPLYVLPVMVLVLALIVRWRAPPRADSVKPA